MIKARQIDSTNVHIVEVGCGNFEIETKSGKENFTGGRYGDSKSVNVTDLVAIRSVETVSVVTHYESGDKSIMGIGTYNDEKARLLAPRYEEVEDEDGDYVRADRWKTLDDEFAYRKFHETWESVSRKVTSISDPLPIEYSKVKFDTGNKFIVAQYAIGGDPAIFEYNRNGAVMQIVVDIMKDLGVERVADKIMSNPSGKQWSNSSRSGIRFLSAWGDYVLSDKWDFSKRQSILRGSLEDMKERHEEYSKELNDIIRSKYQLKFGPFEDSDAATLIKSIAKRVGDLEATLVKVSSKQKTQSELSSAKSIARKLNAEVVSFLSSIQPIQITL
jgi:hypothetical protein